jgi:ketosteroid isomerase-like protein
VSRFSAQDVVAGSSTRRTTRARSCTRLLALLVLGCATAESAPEDSAIAATDVWGDSALAAYVTAQAESTTAAWNAGDLAAFLAPYADSVVVVYPEGPEVGRERVTARLRRNQPWGGNPPTMESRVGRSTIMRLSPDHAIQTVEIILRAPRLPERSHWVTAVWRRLPDGWRVVHEQAF